MVVVDTYTIKFAEASTELVVWPNLSLGVSWAFWKSSMDSVNETTHHRVAGSCYADVIASDRFYNFSWCASGIAADNRAVR